MTRRTHGREPLLAEMHGLERFTHDRRGENEERARLQAFWLQVIETALFDADKRPATGAARQATCDQAREWLSGCPDRDRVCDLAGVDPAVLDRALADLRAAWQANDAGFAPRRRHLKSTPFAWTTLSMSASESSGLRAGACSPHAAESTNCTR